MTMQMSLSFAMFRRFGYFNHVTFEILFVNVSMKYYRAYYSILDFYNTYYLLNILYRDRLYFSTITTSCGINSSLVKV